MPNRDNLWQLAIPFQVHEHGFNYMRFPYIDEYAVATRLDEVIGPAGWQFIIHHTEWRSDTHVTVTAYLEIDGVQKWNTGDHVASPDKNSDLDDYFTKARIGANAQKAAVTDALRRCGRLWGIGRYILQMPNKGNRSGITNHDELSAWLTKHYPEYFAQQLKGKQQWWGLLSRNALMLRLYGTEAALVEAIKVLQNNHVDVDAISYPDLFRNLVQLAQYHKK